VDRDLAVLVGDAADGDQRAWEALVDRLSPLLWSIARGYRLSQPDAEDVIHTAWMRLLERLDRLRDPARVGAWLATTVRHECLRVLRRQGRVAPAGGEELETAADQPTPEAVLLRAERNTLLAHAFHELSQRCQQLLRLLTVRATYEEIAGAMGMPVGAIGPTRGRCLQRLRKRLASGGIIVGLAD
jgi:RNA polymerase sigma factor (sigma-70 family)